MFDRIVRTAKSAPNWIEERLVAAYLLHHPEALEAERKSDLKGEFGVRVTIALLAISWLASKSLDAGVDPWSITIWALALTFVFAARARQRILERFLTPDRLTLMVSRRG